jgi:hypothetical protein
MIQPMDLRLATHTAPNVFVICRLLLTTPMVALTEHLWIGYDVPFTSVSCRTAYTACPDYHIVSRPPVPILMETRRGRLPKTFAL